MIGQALSVLIWIVFTVLVAVIGINVLGYLILGGTPGFGSAQGGGTRVFLLSVLAIPFAALAGLFLGLRITRKRIGKVK